MVGLMAVAAVVTVVQLGLVGSWSRSVRVTTLVQAVGVGFAVLGPVTVAVEWLVVQGLARVGPWGVSTLVRRASWTWDPVVEEVMKVAPLLVLAVVWPRAHRQLGWTDHLLVGSGLGLGFALMEASLRQAAVGPMVMKIGDDYMVGATISGGAVMVPSVGTSLGSWLPDTSPHLLYTGVAVLGVAWVGRGRGWWRVLGVLPVAAASLAHAVGNAGGSFFDAAGLRFVDSGLARTTASVTGWAFDRLAGLLLVALLLAVVLDRAAQARTRRAHGQLLLPGEPWHGLNPGPMAVAGLRAVPWSTVTAWYVVLQRRAGVYALAAGGQVDQASTVAEQVARLGRAGDPVRWRTAARRVAGSLRWRQLVSWRLWVWLVAMVPAVAYLVVGGFPSTRGLQKSMSGPVGTALIVAGLLAGLAVALSQVPGLVRAMRRTGEPAWHEARTRPAARLATVAASLPSAVVLLVGLARAGGNATRPVVRNYHVLDALSQVMIGAGLALLVVALLAVCFPLAGPMLAIVGFEVAEGAAAAASAAAAAEVASAALTLGVPLAASGVVLHEAADFPWPDLGGSGESSGGQGSAGKPSVGDLEAGSLRSGRFTEQDLPRLQDLAKDPAKPAITEGSWEEAEVGLGLEQRGAVRGLVRSQNSAEEFIDSSRQAWDVKAFRSGNFDIDEALKSVYKEIRDGENVMLDTRNLSPEQFIELDDAIKAAGYGGKVLWWP